MPSQREQYGSTVHLFIDAGRSPRKITSMSITFVNGLWKSVEAPEVFSSLSRFPLLPSRRSFPAHSFGYTRPSSGSGFVLAVLHIHNSGSENTCSHNPLGKHCQIMFLRTFGGRRPPTVAFPQGGGGRAPCYPRWAPNMVSPVSCKRVIRVDVRAPFVRGRLGAQRHAQKYLRVICRTRSPGDGVRGLDASLRWDSVTRSFPLVSEMS